MDDKRATFTGWQMAAIAVGLLVLVVSCCSLGLLIGGVAGFSLGRASVRPEPTPEWHIIPLPGVPTPEFPPLLTPVPEERPYLGIRYIMRPRGAEIQEVIPGSPAARTGLRVGDLIREVDGQPVSANRPLAELLSRYRPGDQVTLMVERNGDEQEIRVTLGRWPSP